MLLLWLVLLWDAVALGFLVAVVALAVSNALVELNLEELPLPRGQQPVYMPLRPWRSPASVRYANARSQQPGRTGVEQHDGRTLHKQPRQARTGTR